MDDASGSTRGRRTPTLEELLEGADKMVGSGAVEVIEERVPSKVPRERLVAVQFRVPASVADLIETAVFERKVSKTAFVLRAIAAHYDLPIPPEWQAQTKRRRS